MHDSNAAGIGAILGNGCAIQGKNMLHYSRGVKRHQSFTTGAAFYVYNVISFIFEMVHHGHGSSSSRGYHARNLDQRQITSRTDKSTPRWE